MRRSGRVWRRICCELRASDKHQRLFRVAREGYSVAMTQPFDDIRALFAQFPPPQATAAETARHAGRDLGALAEIAAWIARWRGVATVNRPILSLYAGAHAGGDPAEARERLEAIASGAAPVSRAVQHLGAGLDVFDLAIERPVPDAAIKASMSERECAATMAFGMEALAKQPDLLILGGFGPGADRAAADLVEALAGGDVSAAVARARGEAGDDPLQLLRQLGGRETAAIAGAILAARIQSIPVLLDGAAALAAAQALAAVDADAVAHCRVGHAPPGPQNPDQIARLSGHLPALNLGVDDGTGSIAMLSIVKLATALVSGAPA
ncbi:MAG TPA: nicotinate-nucleotide--dimethylbenzimidazole phosphoribosyltransferase [Caulobacteraceae bacterium]|jgi:nicotinate-nucleotide--dimethylbenzimidazole phosphoribosyltransferase